MIKLPESAMSGARTVPFFVPEITAEAQRAAMRVLASGWLTTGPEVRAFEDEFAEWVGVEHAVAVSSCTAALEIALMAMRLPPGAKVLTSTLTFCGAVHAIVHAGGLPVLVDVHPRTLMPDPATVRAAVRRCGGADALMALHFAGHPAPVVQIAAAAGLPLERVVEDAAHGLGTRVGPVRVGSISGATCFSFYATKNLPIGEGGMLTTPHAGVADFARQARLHGMSRDAWSRYLPGSGWRYAVDVPGLKANLTDLQAAIGRAQLGSLHTWQARREHLARRYHAGLAGVPGVELPLWPDVGHHAWHLYVIRLQDTFGVSRDDAIERLAAAGVSCSVHFIPIHRHRYFDQLLRADRAWFPAAESAYRSILSLPLYPGMSDDDVDYVCAEVAALRSGARRQVLRSAAAAGSTHA